MLTLTPLQEISCPHCSQVFPLQEGLAMQTLAALNETAEKNEAALRDKLRKEEASRLEAISKEEMKRLQQQLLDLAEQRKKDGESAEKLRADAILAEKHRSEQAAIQLRNQTSEHMQEQERKIATLREQEKTLLAEKRSITDQMQNLELENARKLATERDAIAAQVRQIEKEKHDLEMAEQQKKFNDVRSKLEEAQRKAQQGSQQAQGEVLETVLEELLKSAFPIDRIEEVKKGARGADVKQTVMTTRGQAAGTILWEAKRAANWSADWITKLKEDQMNAGAELAVIVTTTMPKELEGQPHGHLDDIFVCSPYAMRALAVTLRIALLEASRQKDMSAGRQEKADAVFGYVTSPQFAQRVRKIDDFMQSQLTSLNKERRAMTQIWKSREQEILSAQETLLNVAGEIRGIAQQALPDLIMEALPLDEGVA